MELDPDKEFLRSLQERLKHNPQDVEALVLMGALEFECFHNDEGAIKILENAIECDPKNVAARFWLGTCLYRYQCDFEKAEKIYREALSIEPTNPACLSLLACITMELNEPILKAIAYVTKAIAAAPTWPMLHCQLSGYLITIGEVEKAEKEAKIALELSLLSTVNPKNEVESYYESVITGRFWKNPYDTMSRTFARIQKAKEEAC